MNLKRLASPANLAKALDADFLTPPHIKLTSWTIARAIHRGGGRVLVMQPPRSGKSLLCSVWTPIWFLELFPHKRVLLASYGSELASSFGRRVRNAINDYGDRLSVRLAADSRAADHWSTTDGGGMLSVGIGAGCTGYGADCLLVDDAVKDAIEASSKTHRENAWRWFQEVARTRLEPSGTIICVGTRWNADDLLGRISAQEDGDKWRRLVFPALAEDEDELGRQPGEALWPARFDVDALEEIKADVGSYAWSALYQQRPSPEGGAIFQRSHFQYFRETPDSYILPDELGEKTIPKARTWTALCADTALTARSWSDYSAVVAFAVCPGGEVLILDVVRE